MKRAVNILSIILLVIFISGVWSSALKNPTYDTDMLFYTGIYYQSEGMTDSEAHQKVYDFKFASLPDSVQQFMSTTEMEKNCRTDFAYFSIMLPFCKVKWLYNVCVRVLTPVSGSPFLAMIFISLISFSLISFLLAFLLSRYLETWLACLFAIFISAFPHVAEVSRIFTPDAFSALLLFSAFLILLLKKKEWLAFLFFFLAILCRPENVLFPIIYSVHEIILSRKVNRQKIFYAVAIVVSIVLFFMIEKITGAYGWKITFQHSLIDSAKSPTAWLNESLSISTFITILIQNTFNHKTELLLIIFFFVLAYFSSKKIEMLSGNNLFKKILFMVSAVMILKFIMHPFFDSRFFTLYYILTLAIISLSVLPWKRNDKIILK